MNNKMMDQDFIDLSVIKKCLEKNKSMQTKGLIQPSLKMLLSIRLINDPAIISYFSGNFKSIQLLASLCSESFYPLFKNDILQVTTFGGKKFEIDPSFFLNFVSDQIALLDDQVISEKYFLDLKLEEIYSIQILRPDLIESKKLTYKMNDLEYDCREFEKIKSHIISLINNEFKTTLTSNDLYNYSNIIKSIKASSKYIKVSPDSQSFEIVKNNNSVNIDRLESLLCDYNKTRNILSLVETILVLGRDESYL